MAQHAKETEVELDEEVFELEFDEESVAYYIVDDDDNEIGVCLIEDGEEVEYMYDDDTKQLNEVQEHLNNVKDELSKYSEDTVVAVKELRQTTEELQNACTEIMNTLKIFGKKS